MHPNLTYYQHKIDCCIYRLLYVSPMVPTKQKPTVDTQKIIRKESKRNNTESRQNTGKKAR